jgi:hypothetical protein
MARSCSSTRTGAGGGRPSRSTSSDGWIGSTGRPPGLRFPQARSSGTCTSTLPTWRAFAFYRDLVGFDEHLLMTQIGMADLSAGGRFPHRMALNDWHGPAALPPPAGTAGLRMVELLVGREDLERTRRRFAAAGHRHAIDSAAIVTADPAGNHLRIASCPI